MRRINDILKEGLRILQQKNNELKNTIIAKEELYKDIIKQLNDNKENDLFKYGEYLANVLNNLLGDEDIEIENDILIEVGIVLAYCNGINIYANQITNNQENLEENILGSFIDSMKDLNVNLILELISFDFANLEVLKSIYEKIKESTNLKDFLYLQFKYWDSFHKMIIDNDCSDSAVKIFIIYYFTAKAITEYFEQITIVKC